ncbi:carboxylating nicotinate-nucleotide diphosphorylase [Parvularcula marina]|uniref:carboxylating nicotinate-nucleotide diphosphorylase n=1 Tax=Parvularcula marina TaxID=2292771 RepID=UPI0035114A31
MNRELTFPLPEAMTADLIMRALTEDLGDAGDISTIATVPKNRPARAELNSRTFGVAAGVEMARRVFRAVDPEIELETLKGDGFALMPGDTILVANGSARSLLTAERVALNILGHMSGIASATARFVEIVEDTGTAIACTRKTLPGLRALQKFAVRCGGGMNHRFGLHDAVMIKDNHIVAAGSIRRALDAARSYAGHTVRVEIEVDTLDQLREVLSAGADIILLDNMAPKALREAVRLTDGRALLEASGNVTLETVREIAETGVDVISSGWITHSAPTLDIGMELSLS